MFNPLHVDPLLVSTKRKKRSKHVFPVLLKMNFISNLAGHFPIHSVYCLFCCLLLDLSFLLIKVITGGSVGSASINAGLETPLRSLDERSDGNTGAIWMNNPWKSPVLGPKQYHKLPETACELRFYFANVYLHARVSAVWLKTYRPIMTL